MEEYLLAVNEEELLYLQKVIIQCQNYSETLFKTFRRFDVLPERVRSAGAALESFKNILDQIEYFLMPRDPEIGHIFLFVLSKNDILTISWELLICQRDFELSLLYCYDDIENVDQKEIDENFKRCTVNVQLLQRIANVIDFQDVFKKDEEN